MRKCFANRVEKWSTRRRELIRQFMFVKKYRQITNLSRDLGVTRKFITASFDRENVERKTRKDKIGDKILNHVKNFYEKKADPVSEAKVVSKDLKPKSVLSSSVTNIFKQYKEEYPNDKIGRTLFHELRPHCVLT